MTEEDALRFLQQNQPMPADADLSQEDAHFYDEVRIFFTQNPSERSIPLLLGSFGNGGGFGVYQMIEDVIKLHSPRIVIPHLVEALTSPIESVQYWCAQIAASFPSTELIAYLATLLESESYDIKCAALIALEQIEDSRVGDVLRTFIDVEQDEELRELALEILAN